MARSEGARPRWWGTAALVISLAAHALVAVMLWRLAGRQQRPRPDGTIEITVETRPAPAPTPPPVVDQAPPARGKDPVRRPRRQEVPAGSRAAAAASPEPDRAAAPSPSPDLLRMRKPGDSLSLDWGAFQAVEGTAAPAPAGSRGPRESAAPSTAQRVAEMLAPSGEDNVRNGKVHPQFYDYLRDAKARFHPALATVEKDAGEPKVAGFFKGWWRSYLQDLAERKGVPDPRETGEEMKGAVELTCDICLTVRLGETPELEVIHHSISEEVDREALMALRHAVDARPLTEPLLPAGARRDGAGKARVCYRFSATARRLPPTLPGCGFDEVTLKAGCTWPLKKIFHSDVKLISAWPG
jgi:hypothetical protein